MALRIKEGSEIYAYGKGCAPFTAQSNLSQEILEHLQSRFPEDIEDDRTPAAEETSEKPKKKKA